MRLIAWSDRSVGHVWCLHFCDWTGLRPEGPFVLHSRVAGIGAKHYEYAVKGDDLEQERCTVSDGEMGGSLMSLCPRDENMKARDGSKVGTGGQQDLVKNAELDARIEGSRDEERVSAAEKIRDKIRSVEEVLSVSLAALSSRQPKLVTQPKKPRGRLEQNVEFHDYQGRVRLPERSNGSPEKGEYLRIKISKVLPNEQSSSKSEKPSTRSTKTPNQSLLMPEPCLSEQVPFDCTNDGTPTKMAPVIQGPESKEGKGKLGLKGTGLVTPRRRAKRRDNAADTVGKGDNIHKTGSTQPPPPVSEMEKSIAPPSFSLHRGKASKQFLEVQAEFSLQQIKELPTRRVALRTPGGLKSRDGSLTERRHRQEKGGRSLVPVDVQALESSVSAGGLTLSPRKGRSMPSGERGSGHRKSNSSNVSQDRIAYAGGGLKLVWNHSQRRWGNKRSSNAFEDGFFCDAKKIEPPKTVDHVPTSSPFLGWSDIQTPVDDFDAVAFPVTSR